MGALFDHISIPKNSRNVSWDTHFFALAEKGRFQFLSNGVGPNGQKYLFAQVLDEESTAGDPLEKFASFAAAETMGMAIFTDPKDQPAATLRYGALWAYKEYKQLGGQPQVVYGYMRALAQDPINPFSAKKSNNNQIQLSQPSEAFLPIYVRQAMLDGVKQVIPDAVPQIALFEQLDFIASKNIAVSAGRNLSTDERMRLGEAMTWYLPPYLPVVIPPNGSG